MKSNVLQQKYPDNWDVKRLQDICITIGGGTPKRSIKEYWGGSIPWLKINDLNDSVITKSSEFLSREGLENSSAKLLPKGTVLLAIYAGASVGKTGILGIECATNQAIVGIIPKTEIIDSYFLFLFLQSQREKLRQLTFGGVQGNISHRVVKNILVPIPPLEVQKRIIKIVNLVKDKISSSTQELSQIPIKTRRLRLAFLFNIFRGGIFRKSSDDLLEMKKTHDFGYHSIPEKWNWVTLESLLSEDLRNGKSAKPAKNKEGVPVLTLSAVTYKDFGPHNVKICDLDSESVRKLWVKKNDIFIARSNTAEYVGMAAIYEGPEDQFIFPDLMIRVRVDESRILPKYLSYYLDSPQARSYFRRESRSTAGSMPKINQTHIKNLLVVLPSLSEQNEIINGLHSRLMRLDSLDKMRKELKSKLDLLERTFLVNIFSGKIAADSIDFEYANRRNHRIRKKTTHQTYLDDYLDES